MSLMMSIHPSDETLSRLADLSEVELLRTRAGRHATRCDECTAAIAELRVLGDAARAIPDVQPSPLLWTRIGNSRAEPVHGAEGSTADALLATPNDSAGRPDGSARRSSSGVVRTASVLAAAAAVVATVLLWPSQSVPHLSAAGLERLVLTPLYPAPGSTIRVRYTPGGVPKADTLWLEADVALTAASASKARPLATTYTAVPLARIAAGEYAGTLVLSRSALAVVVDAVDSMGRSAVPRSSLRELVLTGGASGDRPTLDAMERASELRLGVARQQLAESFTRWAPEHPLRWALSDDSRPADGILDWVRRFTRTERAFSRLDKALSARSHHRVYELYGMIDLGYALEDPAAAGRWADVLVAEHPDDPRALGARARALHQMELDGAPRDSIAALLPSLDSLYVRSGGLLVDRWQVAQLIGRYGDSSTVRRWQLRQVRAGLPGVRGGLPVGNNPDALAWLQDVGVRDSAEAYARELLMSSPAPVFRVARFERMWAFTTLAGIAYWRSDARGAVAWTDSAQAVGDSCAKPATYVRVVALLAVGDTLRAEEALAERWWWRDASPDSARVLLGDRFDASRWQSKVAAAQQRYRACHANKN
jgi:hypothetical protein